MFLEPKYGTADFIIKVFSTDATATFIYVDTIPYIKPSIVSASSFNLKKR